MGKEKESEYLITLDKLLELATELADLRARVSVLAELVDEELNDKYPDNLAKRVAQIFGWKTSKGNDKQG